MERSVHFIRVGKSQSLKLELRVLPVKGRISWFTCEHHQEVINLLQGVIEAKLEALSTRGKTLDKVIAQQEPDVITGATLRVACCFKKNEVHHTFLVDTRHLGNTSNSSSDISSEEEGTPNIGGSYRSFRVEQLRLVACVCQYSTEYPQTLPMDKLVQGLSQIPQRETTDISNYFSRAPEETTTAMSDGPKVPVAGEKSRNNLHEMMKRGKLLKKKSKRKTHQTHKDTASSSHVSESDSMDQSVPDTTRNHIETQTEDPASDEVEESPIDEIVEEENVSDWLEEIPSVGVPSNIKMIVREGTSEEITNAVAMSCQESNTFPDIQESQVEDPLPENPPKRKRGRPRKNRDATSSENKDGDVERHKMRPNGGNSVGRVREDGHKDEAKGVDTMILHKDHTDVTNGMTDRGDTKHGMLQTNNTEDHKNVLDNNLFESVGQDSNDVETKSSHFSAINHQDSFLDTKDHVLDNDAFESHVQDSTEVETKSSLFSAKSHQHSFLDTKDSENVLDNDAFESHVQDSTEVKKKSSLFSAKSHKHSSLDTSYGAKENKYPDADRPTKISTGAGPSGLDHNNDRRSDLKTQFEDKPTEASLTNSFRTTISETKTKRKLDSPLNKPPSKLSKLSRKKGRTAVRKNCFDDFLSSQDIQEDVVDDEDEDKKQKSCDKPSSNTVALPTPSSTETEDYDSEHSGYSKSHNASKNSVGVNMTLDKRSSKHPYSQEEPTSRRAQKIQRKMKKKVQEIYEDELHADVNKGSFSEQDTHSSNVPTGGDDASADDNVVVSKSRQKQSTHKVSSTASPLQVEKLKMSPVVKVMDISQAEQFRRILSPVLEKVKGSTSSQGSPSSKNEVQESRSQDSHLSKQRATSQVMRKRLGFRRHRSKVFDLDSAESSGCEDNRNGFEGKTRQTRSTVFDQDLDSCSTVSDEDAVSSQDIEAKRGSDTNRTYHNDSKDRQREKKKALINAFELDMDENDVDVNNEIPTQPSKRVAQTHTKAVTTKKVGRPKKSKVVLEDDSKDNRAAKRSSKADSRPSQDVKRSNKRQGVCKTRVSKKSKVRDDPDSDPDIVDEENTIDMQNGDSTIEEAMDVPENEMDEMFFDMDDPGAVDEWQTTELEESIKKIRHVKDLDSDQIRYLVKKDERYLKHIFKGKISCRRHEDYKRGGAARADLNFQVRLGMFHEAQQDEVLEVLNAIFCPAGNNKYLDYVFKVLLPEALIKIHMHISGASHDESEYTMQQALSRRSLCASMSMSD
ncbi:Hypp2676 [Branchiostoma lanceolatum]|uniref:Hypp2676 protein n=1 Tax=Branchiostoma lanceolatum TaxID=7740 RepID=A0A8J9ZU04_BRALA|nr:Hypp2676 [Branchiostoma lanceolatum]